jgi:hypothetical protein
MKRSSRGTHLGCRESPEGDGFCWRWWVAPLFEGGRWWCYPTVLQPRQGAKWRPGGLAMLLIQMARCGRVLIGEAMMRADPRVSRLNSKKLKIVGCLFIGIFALRHVQQGVNLDPYLKFKFKLSFC